MNRSWAWIATFVMGLLSTGCGSNPTPPAPAAPGGVASTPTNASSGSSTSSGSGESGSSEANGMSNSGYGSEPSSDSSSESSAMSGGYPGGQSSGASSSAEERAYNGGAAYSGEPGYNPDGAYNPDGGSGSGYPSNPAGGGMFPGMVGAPGMVLSRLMSGASQRAPKKLSHRERSVLAFEAGNTDRAIDLLSAQALVSDDSESMKISDLYRWSNASKRPVLGIKIAVGLVLDNPSNATSLKPIGTELQSIMSGGGAGGGPGGGSGAPGPAAVGLESGSGMGVGMESGSGFGTPGAGGAANPILAAGAKPLTDAAGELASQFLKALGPHHAEGKWSVAFQENSYKGKPRSPGNNGSGVPGSFGPGGGNFGGPGISGEFEGDSGSGLGAGGMSAGAIMPFRFQQGGGPAVGAVASGVAGIPGPTSGATSSGFGQEEESPAGFGPGAPGGFGDPSGFNGQGGFGGQMPNGRNMAASLPQWVAEDFELPAGVTPLGPCIDYIGSDDQAGLLAAAAEGGYDALVIFDVEIALNRRTGIVNNTARIKVLSIAEDVKESKVIASSKTLVNVTVARARTKKEDDGVESAAESVAKKMSELISIQPIPDRMTQDAVVKSRMPKLLADSKISQLGKLGEVNFYYQKGFIDDSQRREYFETIAGAEAAKLFASKRSEKVDAVEALLK